MFTYYVRHRMDVDAPTIKRLWRDKRIAIHFPEDVKGNLPPRDNSSLDPRKYKKGRIAMKRLNELAKEGGYVCATFQDSPQCFVGFVPPGSKIELIKGTWGELNGYIGRTAILKSLKLRKVRVLSASRSLQASIGRPRQGTISRWWRVGERIQNTVEGVSSIKSAEALLTSQQEVMCSEFLRSSKAASMGLPLVSHYLTSVGRTMADIDLLGITSSGIRVLAQVTFTDLADCAYKLNALRKYRERGTKLILFCNCEKQHRDGDVSIIPLDEVFTRFTGTNTGNKWLQHILLG